MQNKGLNRNTIDKFYTKKEIAKICIELFEEYVKPDKDDIIIEPSAGSGSFSNELIKRYNNIIAIDIEPDNKNIKKLDYLNDFNILSETEGISTKELGVSNKKIHVIGNPPFGRQSGLAKKFIKKSTNFSNSISFILPKSFKKDSFQKTIPLNFHLEYSYNIPTNSFYLNDKDYNVECVFQIWIKKEKNRAVSNIKKPDFYNYVKREENPDLSFRRVGVYAGEISKEINKSQQSHYFIKFNNNENNFVDKFIQVYNQHKNFSFDNTVGPKSISKQELNSFVSSLIDFF
jgi:predicted RNA methylase